MLAISFLMPYTNKCKEQQNNIRTNSDGLRNSNITQSTTNKYKNVYEKEKNNNEKC